ncbi:MAG TPA: hypothetical protein VG651_02220 [Stellaceae bacterium]|nr:hypothetical protein [Stellaceae bacterium]
MQERKTGWRSLLSRLDRAAGDLNPFLMALAVGLVVLNLTLYIGIAAAGGARHAPDGAAGGRMTPAASSYPAPGDYVR